MKRAVNVGDKYGRLTITSLLKEEGKKYIVCDCLCVCGSRKRVASYNLRSGHTVSCGCYRVETTVSRNKTHGLRGHHLYGVWSGMVNRCTNSKYIYYKDYGGRGIKVCDKWLHSFENFYEDMGDRPSPQHSIDRIDNNGDYTPDNCRWATKTEQSTNRRSSRLTKSDVALIRDSQDSSYKLSVLFGVTQYTINDVRSKRTWAD